MLPWKHDDFAGALAEAKRTNKPLFVDAWAPWCHSCLSLQAYVLSSPTLTPLARDFVWLSIDTEKEQNAEWVTRFPHQALPTLWIIDPTTEKPILKWMGGATAEELRALLDVSRRGANGDAMDASVAFVQGNRAAAADDVATAEKSYRAALAAAKKDHPHRPRIVEALVGLLVIEKDHAACAEVAAANVADLPPSTSRATSTAMGLSCAREAKDRAKEDQLLAIALADVNASDGRVLADDRSALFEEIIETKKERGDEAGAKETGSAWARFLEAEAAKAKTPAERVVFDAHRLSAYLAIGEPVRAITMLEASERDFPNDYNPPARLARAYLSLKKLDEADAAADRAIARVYGPRAMRVYEVKADVAKAKGDKAKERAALEEALARSAKGALTSGQKRVRDGLAKRLGALR